MGLQVKFGFLQACGVPQTALCAETHPGDPDLPCCLQSKGNTERLNSKPGDNVQEETKAYFLLCYHSHTASGQT